MVKLIIKILLIFIILLFVITSILEFFSSVWGVKIQNPFIPGGFRNIYNRIRYFLALNTGGKFLLIFTGFLILILYSLFFKPFHYNTEILLAVGPFPVFSQLLLYLDYTRRGLYRRNREYSTCDACFQNLDKRVWKFLGLPMVITASIVGSIGIARSYPPQVAVLSGIIFLLFAVWLGASSAYTPTEHLIRWSGILLLWMGVALYLQYFTYMTQYHPEWLNRSRWITGILFLLNLIFVALSVIKGRRIEHLESELKKN